jgi:5-methylcytosine-specific restriction endonuclease McrA
MASQVYPMIRSLFPNIQIIASTQSPFIVTSVPNAKFFTIDRIGNESYIDDRSSDAQRWTVEQTLMLFGVSGISIELEKYIDEFNLLNELSTTRRLSYSERRRIKEISIILAATDPKFRLLAQLEEIPDNINELMEKLRGNRVRRIYRYNLPKLYKSNLNSIQSEWSNNRVLRQENPKWHENIWRKEYRTFLQRIQGGRCAFCDTFTAGGSNGEVEHYLYKKRYIHHKFRWDNWVLSCPSCNRAKSTRDVLAENWLDSRNSNPADFFQYYLQVILFLEKN